MGQIGCVRCQKIFVPRTFALIAPLQPILYRVSSSYETIPNAPEHYETHQNMSLGSNGVDQVRWGCEQLQRDFVAQNLLNCTKSICSATSFMQLRNDPKCSEILRNGPKYSEILRNISFGSNGPDWVCSL